MIGTALLASRRLRQTADLVESREHQVEHDQVDRLGAVALERLLPVPGLHDAIALALERVR